MSIYSASCLLVIFMKQQGGLLFMSMLLLFNAGPL